MPRPRPDLLFGSFLTPAAQGAHDVVALAQLSERVGLDLVTFQDHPYLPQFLDTWTLLAYVAARTEYVRLAPNVLNLPMRQPVVVARSAASLDLLTGGRFELGLGAGGFWDAIEAAGIGRLTAGQAVDALDEAIQIIRGVWDAAAPGALRVDGRHHHVQGTKRGPAPSHDIGIWLGAYKPRMLALVGRAADGWLPSLGYLPDVSELGRMNAVIDEAAAEAGRDPDAIRRLLNISGSFSDRSSGLLNGPAGQWAEELAGIALDYGTSAFILGSDDPRSLHVFAQEVAPAVRELVEAEARTPQTHEPEQTARQLPVVTVTSVDDALGVRPTPDDGARLSHTRVWDETLRPAGPARDSGRDYSASGQAAAQHLVDVHDHLRGELAQVRDLIRQVREGILQIGDARSALNEMALRQNSWTLGGFCESYCRLVTGHHGLEDQAIFPHLRTGDPRIAPVIDRLEEEHRAIHHVLDGVDASLVHLVAHPDDIGRVEAAVDLLSDVLLSHLSSEERELVEPLARLGFYAGQL